MVKPQNLTGLFIFAILFCIGLLVTSTVHVRAQDNCEITIEKVAIPADDTPFNFLVTGGPPDFTLMDPSATTELIDIIAADDGNPANVTEQLPPGWILDGIECTLPTGGFCQNPDGMPTPCVTVIPVPEENRLEIECYDDGEVTCTFTNSQVITNVPTLSEWGLIAMAGILGIVGYLVMRRKRVTA